MADEHGASQVFGVATQAFRLSSNGAESIEFLKSQLQIPIEIISAEEEARLGFLNGKALVDVPDD